MINENQTTNLEKNQLISLLKCWDHKDFTRHSFRTSTTEARRCRISNTILNATFNEESMAKFKDNSKKLKEQKDSFQIPTKLIRRTRARKLQETKQSFLMHIKEGNVFA